MYDLFCHRSKPYPAWDFAFSFHSQHSSFNPIETFDHKEHLREHDLCLGDVRLNGDLQKLHNVIMAESLDVVANDGSMINSEAIRGK